MDLHECVRRCWTSVNSVNGHVWEFAKQRDLSETPETDWLGEGRSLSAPL